MKEKKQTLRPFLQSALNELNKLAGQIRETQDYSDQAEIFLTLRELVEEQIEATPSENTHTSAHAIR